MDNETQLPCVTTFGALQGSQMVELIERTTGQLCPCRQGLACPIVPSAGAMLEVITTPPAVAS